MSSAALLGWPKTSNEVRKDMNRKRFPAVAAVLASLALLTAALSAQEDRSLEIPSGTTISVRMIDKLSSEQNQIGDTFHGTLDEPIEVNGRELYPKGADVIGRVTDVHPTGRLSEPGELDLVLNTVSSGTVAASIHVEPLVIKGESHSKSNVTKIGGGAALGAVIGAIAGGGKGAAIGTLAGGAAGTGAAAATGKKPATGRFGSGPDFCDFDSLDSDCATAAKRHAGSEFCSPNSSAPNANASGPAAIGSAHCNSSLGPDGPPPDSTSAPTIPPTLFTLRDRRIIRDCVNEHSSDLPAGVRPSVPNCPPGRSAKFIAAGICPPRSRTRPRPCRWPAKINCPSYPVIWSVSSTAGGCC